MSIKIICRGSLSIPTTLNAVQSDSIIARSQRSEEFCNTIPPHSGHRAAPRRCQLWARSGHLVPQSALTPAALITAAHFSISLSTNFCRYSGDRRSEETTVPPISFIRPVRPGCSWATVASWSFWAIARACPWARRTHSSYRLRTLSGLVRARLRSFAASASGSWTRLRSPAPRCSRSARRRSK